jgi:MFS family permease
MLSLGYETIAIGRLISIGLVALVIAQVPAGLLIDRIGRKNGILLGLCVYAIFPIFYPFCSDYLLFSVIATVSGIANAILIPASFAFVAEVVPREIRSVAMTLAYFASGVLTFGPFFGGVLYTMHKALPFIACSLLTIMTIAAFYVFLPSLKSSSAKDKGIKKVGELAKVFRRSLVGIFFANFAYSFGAGMLSLVVPIFLLSVLGEPILQTGFALVVPQVVCFIVSFFVGGWMSKRGRKKKLLIVGLIGCGIFALAFTLVRTAFEVVLVWTFLMLMGILIGSSSSTMLAEFSEKSFRATSMAVYSFFGTFGIIISMQLIGDVKETSLSQAPFYMVALLCAIGAMIILITVEEKN